MNIEESKNLTSKCMKVILSCENYDQLCVAMNYRKLNRAIGLTNDSSIVELTDRCVGFTQCKIKNLQETEK